MEIVHVIFEKYGGRQVARIFRTYLILSLVLKELMFSLFSIPEEGSAIDPGATNGTCIFGKEHTAETDFNSPDILLHISGLSRDAAEKISAAQICRPTNPLPRHENI